SSSTTYNWRSADAPPRGLECSLSGTPPGSARFCEAEVHFPRAAATGRWGVGALRRGRGYGLKREILINGSQRETRVAILEDDRLVELLVDRPDHRRTVGDIYLGRVEAVLPGIQAAFVDIGQEKSAFLHASDLLEPEEDDEPDDEEVEEPGESPIEAELAATESVVEAAAEEPNQERKGPWRSRDRRRRRNNGAGERSDQSERRQREISPRRALPNIQDILKKGQTLPVQVTK